MVDKKNSIFMVLLSLGGGAEKSFQRLFQTWIRRSI